MEVRHCSLFSKIARVLRKISIVKKNRARHFSKFYFSYFIVHDFLGASKVHEPKIITSESLLHNAPLVFHPSLVPQPMLHKPAVQLHN